MTKETNVIDYNKLISWLNSKNQTLGGYVVKGKKILINSPWKQDNKKHMALLFERGKYGRFRDFKSSKSGNIVDFVMEIDNCNFKSAIKKIGKNRPRDIREIFKTAKIEITNETIVDYDSKISLPPGCIEIKKKNSLSASIKAANYLRRRGIEPSLHKLYCATQNRSIKNPSTNETIWQNLEGRIVIPYYDYNNNLVYWSARSIDPLCKIRYIEPYEFETKKRKQDVVFTPSWDILNKQIFIVEGPIDAISLSQCGLNAIAIGGSGLFMGQKKIIQKISKNIIIATDNDCAGRKCALQINKEMKVQKIIIPPKGEDWNSAMVKVGMQNLKKFIYSNILDFSEDLKFKFEISTSVS